MSRARFDGPRPSAEHWMARKLGLPLDWDGGTTSGEQRREAIRESILRRCLNYATAGRNPQGQSETWAELFERLYGAPLDPTDSEGQSIPNNPEAIA